ncbi:winged helix-turn-helix domain-containing protein [Patescibacteria group bacterium]|nr:winged helix-turn-helix domain-containing protein [Patescibacteria group bacterium]
MKNGDGVTLSDKFLTDFTKDVFLPAKKGESVTCLFTAGGGKRTLFNYLLKEKSFIKQVFGEEFDTTLFVFVDPDEILNVSNEAYLQLILDNLVLEMSKNNIEPVSKPALKNPLILIKENLAMLLEKNWRAVFILNDFEFTLNLSSTIYLNLESIHNLESSMFVSRSKIVFLFLATLNLLDETVIKSFGDLKYGIAKNVKFFPLFDQEQSYYLLDRIGEKLGKKISGPLKSALYEVCGGHPRLLKYSLNLIFKSGMIDETGKNKIIDFLCDKYQLKIICADVWNFLSEQERATIVSIVNNGSITDSQNENAQYLSKLSIVRKTGDKYQVFGEIFRQFVKNKLPKQRLLLDTNAKKLFYGGKSCEDKFSFQEYSILVFLINHENQLVTRDQIAEAIWGKNYLDKYSDWSIDKSISLLRKKLDALGFPSENLKTLKKRGFSFFNPS